jgi:hypothetical protein
MKNPLKRLVSNLLLLVFLVSLSSAIAMADSPPTGGYTGSVATFSNPTYPTAFTHYITRVGANLVDGTQALRFVGYNADGTIIPTRPNAPL